MFFSIRGLADAYIIVRDFDKSSRSIRHWVKYACLWPIKLDGSTGLAYAPLDTLHIQTRFHADLLRYRPEMQIQDVHEFALAVHRIPTGLGMHLYDMMKMMVFTNVFDRCLSVVDHAWPLSWLPSRSY